MTCIRYILCIYLIILTSSVAKAATRSNSNNVFRFDPIVVTEEPPIGTLVLDLAAKLDITDLASSDYKFRFYSPHSLTSHYFLIDQLTGHVKTQRSLDREYLCENKICGPCSGVSGSCSLPVEIVATHASSNRQKFVSFDVWIEDKNEYAPKFPRDIIYLNLSEAAPPNFVIPIDAAYDRDSKQTHINYSLEPVVTQSRLSPDGYLIETEGPLSDEYDSEMKKLTAKISLVTTDSNGQSQLSLIIREPFDYEQEKEVRFRILASDGDLTSSSSNTSSSKSHSKPLVGSCLVIVKIIDINDNLPVFDQTQYEYRIDENKAVAGTKLIRVHATDKDDGLNGLVKYSLVDHDLASSPQQSSKPNIQHRLQRATRVKELFQIDETSGWISLIGNLDYEQEPVYRLVVQAQDSGLANSMPVYTQVIIYLNDINDNPPVVNITAPNSIDDFNTNLTLSDKNRIELSELTLPDTFIAQIIVTDADSGTNGEFKLDMTQTKRKTSVDDAEDENIEDDEYDNDDLSQDAEWVTSNDFSLVHLFNNIYSLMTKEKLDREAFDMYLINLTATDNGQPVPLKTIVNLSIRIKDENDNAPEFLPVSSESMKSIMSGNKLESYEFNVLEEHSSQAEDSNDEWVQLGQVKAIDRDQNSKLTYSLESNAHESFRIDSVTGQVDAKRRILDREIKDKYDLIATASDGVNTARMALTVRLVDRNDNAPRFEHSIYKFQVYENMLNNDRPFAKVIAHDSDSGNHSHIQYKIVSGNEDKYFEISQRTGELVQLKEIDFEQVKQVEFKVLAYDNYNKSPSHNTTCLVQIEIIDLNDNKPSLVYPQQSDLPLTFFLDSIRNQSKSSKSSFLFTLNATDFDSTQNGQIKFEMQKQIKLRQKGQQGHDSNGVLFDIDSNTGDVSVRLMSKSKRDVQNEMIKDEHEGIFGLIINIKDQGVDPLASRVYVFIVLAKNELSIVNLQPQINLLGTILNQTRLYVDDEDDLDYYEDYSDKPSSDPRFDRVIEQFKNFKPKNKDLKLLRKNGMSSGFDMNSITRLVNQMLTSVSRNAHYKSALALTILSCFVFTIILISLCMLSVYFKNKRAFKQKKLNEKSIGKLDGTSASSSSSTLTKTNRTHSTLIKHDIGSSANTNSPSSGSMTSSEMLVDSVDSHHISATTPKILAKQANRNPAAYSNLTLMNNRRQQANGTSTFVPSEDMLKLNKCHTLGKTTLHHQFNRNDLNLSCTSGEEERAALIYSTNSPILLTHSNTTPQGHSSSSPTSSSSSSSNNVLSNHTDSTIMSANIYPKTATVTNVYSKIVNKQVNNQQLSVLVTTQNQQPTSRKCMVASTESLTSINTVSNDESAKSKKLSSSSASSSSPNNETMTSYSPHESLSSKSSTVAGENSNFKTFKQNNSSSTTSSPQTYRTLPKNVNIYHNQNNSTRPVLKKSMLDQKQLNLPVNELFKRYELKRQATLTEQRQQQQVIQSLSSSGSTNSLNNTSSSLSSSSAHQHQPVEASNAVSTFITSPRLAHRTNNLISDGTANGQIPDYFFKDEKEHRRFLASTNHAKPMLTLKQVNINNEIL